MNLTGNIYVFHWTWVTIEALFDSPEGSPEWLRTFAMKKRACLQISSAPDQVTQPLRVASWSLGCRSALGEQQGLVLLPGAGSGLRSLSARLALPLPLRPVQGPGELHSGPSLHCLAPALPLAGLPWAAGLPRAAGLPQAFCCSLLLIAYGAYGSDTERL